MGFPDAASLKQSVHFLPMHGDVVDIHCNVPYGDNHKPLLFRGRIVRVDVDGAGLAFIDPDMDALHGLHHYAMHRLENSAAQTDQFENLSDSSASDLSDLTRQTLLVTCRRMSRAHAEPLADAFLRHALVRLENAALTTESLPNRNAFYDAMSVVKRQGESLKRAFIEHTGQQLDRSPAGTLTQFRDLKGGFSSKTPLSLIEDEVFEEWLSFSDLAHKAEAACQAQLSALTQRIGALFKMPVDKENNPFGPAAFGKAFQQTVREFKFEPVTWPVLYAIYRDALIVQLDELYGNLNDFLIKNRVLANLRHPFTVKPAGAGRSLHESGPSASTQDANTVRPHISDARGIQTQETAGNTGSASGASVHPKTSSSDHDWYSLMQNLDALQKQVVREYEYRAQPACFPSPMPSATPEFYTAQELALALSRFRLPITPDLAATESTPSLRTQLLSVLSSDAGSEPKSLQCREEKILDMTGNLLDSVLSDKLLAENVRPWLQQLTIPVARTALMDESVFFDRSHLVRQLVNAVAQLEFYGNDEGDQAGQVNQKVEGLLAEIQSADPLSPEMLDRALKEFNLLVQLQNKAYADNLAEVLAACAGETPPGDACATAPGMLSGDDDGEALYVWKRRIRRLKPGDSLLVNDSSRARRLKLAWISPDFARFVFVNIKGLQERVLSDDELARNLSKGAWTVLDDGGEPLLDRAQYSMLQKMHSHLLHETTHDQLTGLVNRREFERRLGEALTNARQRESRHVVCYIDLTQFNVVNNTFGYDGGDRLLIEVAALFGAQLDGRGILARIGGDEFGILLEDCTIEDALKITARHKEAMQDYRFTAGERSLTVCFSAGLVAVSAESDNIVTLLQAAEACCRIARGKGSNYVQVFSAENAELFHHMEVLKWVTKIDEALDRESFDLRHQPIVGIEGDAITVHHSEVLLGLLNDEGELISPSEFVLAAENFRRMAAVDRWVIEHAFKWMVTHEDRLNEIGGLAINLSGSSLNEEGFVDFILEQASRLNVPMSKVCFEITETAGIANLSNASEFILAVKKTGCVFALDDFGSGLSSYAYLKNLPVDFLKIDGMFIKNMDRNPYDFAVVKSITEIGHFMGKKIIAEFVESEAILALLREIGVDFAQGYAIAKPQSLKMLNG